MNIQQTNFITKTSKRAEKPIIQFTDEFLEVWDMYPNKKGKKLAFRYYTVLRRKWSQQEIIEAIEEYTAEVKDNEKRYIKQGCSFFSERIHDYLGVAKTEKITNYSVEIDLYTQLIKKFNAMNYADYLNTEHWKHFREQVFMFYGRECQICKSKASLNVHHKTYENKGRETFNDVILLCRECHTKIHGL